jgi:hypothetical protein
MEIKRVYLIFNKAGRLSDKATQNRGDKSDFVRPMYKLSCSLE